MQYRAGMRHGVQRGAGTRQWLSTIFAGEPEFVERLCTNADGSFTVISGHAGGVYGEKIHFTFDEEGNAQTLISGEIRRKVSGKFYASDSASKPISSSTTVFGNLSGQAGLVSMHHQSCGAC